MAVLSGPLPVPLVEDLVENFLTLRQDVATNTLGRSAPGKFVETLVQILQFLESRKYDQQPNIDEYLRTLESRSSSALDDGLRICASRIGRAMYTLRNKRNIQHKGQVDPNTYDLQFLPAGAQWVLAELVRSITGVPMAEAGKLVEQIHTPIGGLVEDFGNRKLFLSELSVPDEILLLLHSHYPDFVSTQEILSSLDRQKGGRTVQNRLRDLWRGRLIEGNNETGYKLTMRGFSKAVSVVRHCIARILTDRQSCPVHRRAY